MTSPRRIAGPDTDQVRVGQPRRGEQQTRVQEPDLQAGTGGPGDVEVPPWRGRFVLYLVGAALLAFGLRGITRDANGWTHPTYWAPALVLLALAHDLVLVPAVFGAAAVLGRLVPGPARRFLAAALGLSGVALALAWPGLRGYGRLPDNPSVLPLDYASGLRSVLLVLWLGLLAAFLLRAAREELRSGRPRSRVPTAPADGPTQSGPLRT